MGLPTNLLAKSMNDDTREIVRWLLLFALVMVVSALAWGI